MTLSSLAPPASNGCQKVCTVCYRLQGFSHIAHLTFAMLHQTCVSLKINVAVQRLRSGVYICMYQPFDEVTKVYCNRCTALCEADTWTRNLLLAARACACRESIPKLLANICFAHSSTYSGLTFVCFDFAGQCEASVPADQPADAGHRF